MGLRTVPSNECPSKHSRATVARDVSSNTFQEPLLNRTFGMMLDHQHQPQNTHTSTTFHWLSHAHARPRRQTLTSRRLQHSPLSEHTVLRITPRSTRNVHTLSVAHKELHARLTRACMTSKHLEQVAFGSCVRKTCVAHLLDQDTEHTCVPQFVCHTTNRRKNSAPRRKQHVIIAHV